MQLPDEVFGKCGYGVGIARQPGDDRRQHQTIAGRQAGAALTLEPDLHAAQALQHAGQPARDAWYRHWIELGFTALEDWLARDPSRGRFCFGDAPTMADVCLVPQVFNARRFSVDLAAYPRVVAIDAACQELPAFAGASPDKQTS